ncbi:unnamed protein product [Darwinula stevensoni]|uniref:Transmembrane protein n=1 Tax=Darwinula stevensoni TaxID=69355 RepID=A0A7R9ACM4_9CRUS|nr:unnamed protein product [Darwinula stevensoni]CAG0900306.1 unnamed protein product [Darwinula stevensoni]
MRLRRFRKPARDGAVVAIEVSNAYAVIILKYIFGLSKLLFGVGMLVVTDSTVVGIVAVALGVFLLSIGFVGNYTLNRGVRRLRVKKMFPMPETLGDRESATSDPSQEQESAGSRYEESAGSRYGWRDEPDASPPTAVAIIHPSYEESEFRAVDFGRLAFSVEEERTPVAGARGFAAQEEGPLYSVDLGDPTPSYSRGSSGHPPSHSLHEGRNSPPEARANYMLYGEKDSRMGPRFSSLESVPLREDDVVSVAGFPGFEQAFTVRVRRSVPSFRFVVCEVGNAYAVILVLGIFGLSEFFYGLGLLNSDHTTAATLFIVIGLGLLFLAFLLGYALHLGVRRLRVEKMFPRPRPLLSNRDVSADDEGEGHDGDREPTAMGGDGTVGEPSPSSTMAVIHPTYEETAFRLADFGKLTFSVEEEYRPESVTRPPWGSSPPSSHTQDSGERPSSFSRGDQKGTLAWVDLHALHAPSHPGGSSPSETGENYI